jgi:hypothetical protein
VTGVPFVLSAGAIQDRDTDPVVDDGGAVTSIVNGAKEAVALPSRAVRMILPVVPTLLLAGVPEIWPVLASRLAQLGKPVAVKVAAPLLVDTVGWNI